jgi:hypothetical protein
MAHFNKRKLMVFISSNYKDLVEERQAAVEAILAAGHIPAGMELFTAGDEGQMEVIKQWIDESDVFLLILGGRYGSVEPKSGKSYTQLEYEYAIETKKSYFACVIKESQIDVIARTRGVDVIERKYGRELEDFRKQVLSRISKIWTDAKDIRVEVANKLGQLSQDSTLRGWVRPEPEKKSVRSRVGMISATTSNPEPAGARASNPWTAGLRTLVSDSGPSKPPLSDEAKSILLSASKSRDGTILYNAFATNDWKIVVGENSHVVAEGLLIDGRLHAKWEAALESLHGRGLIKPESVKQGSGYYRLTEAGYHLADQIAKRPGDKLMTPYELVLADLHKIGAGGIASYQGIGEKQIIVNQSKGGLSQEQKDQITRRAAGDGYGVLFRPPEG